MKWFKKFRDKNKFSIVERSNVIQHDDMGYPLRLCIGSDGKQHWRDTNEREGDVVLEWELEERFPPTRQLAIISIEEETEVKRDKKWLVDKLTKERNNTYVHDPEYQYLSEFIAEVNQLEEPEVTLDKAFEKVAESYSMTKEKIWRHLERLEAHGGEVTYGEQEALSQEWIRNNQERNPEVDQHKELLDELNDLYARKNQDYGNSFDESLDEDGLLVLKIRLGDKFKRFSQLINNEQMVNDESMRDTLIDLANYALMGVLWMDNQEED